MGKLHFICILCVWLGYWLTLLGLRLCELLDLLNLWGLLMLIDVEAAKWVFCLFNVVLPVGLAGVAKTSIFVLLLGVFKLLPSLLYLLLFGVRKPVKLWFFSFVKQLGDKFSFMQCPSGLNLFISVLRDLKLCPGTIELRCASWLSRCSWNSKKYQHLTHGEKYWLAKQLCHDKHKPGNWSMKRPNYQHLWRFCLAFCCWSVGSDVFLSNLDFAFPQPVIIF